MKKLLLKCFIGLGSVVGAWLLFYLVFLPKILTSDFIVQKIESLIKEQTGFGLTIVKPDLETKLTPDIELKIPKLELKKGDKLLADVEDFELEFNFGKILSHNIRLDELKVKNLTVDGSGIIQNLPQQAQETKPNDWKIDFANADLILESGILTYNNSVVNFAFENFETKVWSDKFYVVDIFELVKSNIFIPNGKELLSPLSNPSGIVKFDVALKNDEFSGSINLKNSKASVKDLSNMPITLAKGEILVSPDKLVFKDLAGFYGKNSANKIKIYGDIKDYYKSFDSNLTIDTVATNEFTKDYLAPLLGGVVLKFTQNVPTRLLYKAKNNKMNITWLAKIAKGVSFGADDTPSMLVEYDRAVKGEFFLDGNELDIRDVNYYIAKDIYKGMAKIDPVLVFDGKMNIATGELKEAGFKFGHELPCEFLNVGLRQKFFKGGTIKGDLHAVFRHNVPKLTANMQILNTRIPSQRLRISEATLSTNHEEISIKANGGFKRIKYDIDGVIKNELLTPVIVKKLDMTVDNVNVERLLASVNQDQNQTATTISESDDDNFMFDTSLLVIEDCNFKVLKGFYKDLVFGDINAKMTLDKDGIVKIQAPWFDIAEGISTLRVQCDLKNFDYYLRLGLKNVNMDIISTNLLNLSKEISGKGSALVELNSDKSLKLNGQIKFLIDDGAIGKIGVVEYLLKVAAIFRNPIVMISPTTFFDLVNIPEGKFDQIDGVLKLKDNVITRMDIKSYSPTLSALIRGRYDLENQDASLRIFTRFSGTNKGFLGFMRHISLNALANKVKISGRNDANYYASDLKDLPSIDAKDENTQIFYTQVEGDVEHNNFLSGLKKIK